MFPLKIGVKVFAYIEQISRNHDFSEGKNKKIDFSTYLLLSGKNFLLETILLEKSYWKKSRKGQIHFKFR